MAEENSRESAGAAPRSLHEGDRFPLTALGAPDGQLPRPAVVYFYPKDGTETCTREAAAFQRHAAEYAGANIDIVGVSTDDAEIHQRFAADKGLAFALVSDENGTLADRVGALKDYGEHGVLAARVTFLLDTDGTVQGVFHPDDEVTAHPAEVLDAARRAGLTGQAATDDGGRT